MTTATLADPLDALRELVTEAAEYAGPEDDTDGSGPNSGIWQAIDAAEAAIPALQRALGAIETIRAILWPTRDPDAEWSVETIEYVAETLVRLGFGARCSHWRTCRHSACRATREAMA